MTKNQKVWPSQGLLSPPERKNYSLALNHGYNPQLYETKSLSHLTYSLAYCQCFCITNFVRNPVNPHNGNGEKKRVILLLDWKSTVQREKSLLWGFLLSQLSTCFIISKYNGAMELPFLLGWSQTFILFLSLLLMYKHDLKFHSSKCHYFKRYSVVSIEKWTVFFLCFEKRYNGVYK